MRSIIAIHHQGDGIVLSPVAGVDRAPGGLSPLGLDLAGRSQPQPVPGGVHTRHQVSIAQRRTAATRRPPMPFVERFGAILPCPLCRVAPVAAGTRVVSGLAQSVAGDLIGKYSTALLRSPRVRNWSAASLPPMAPRMASLNA